MDMSVRSRFKWYLEKFICKKEPGLIAIEAVVALIIASIGLSTTAYMCRDLQQMEAESSLKTDRALAFHMLREFNIDKVIIHDHVYKIKDGNIYDQTVSEKAEF